MMKNITKNQFLIVMLGSIVFSSCSYQGSTPEDDGSSAGRMNVSKEDVKNLMPTDVDMAAIPSGQKSHPVTTTPPNSQANQDAKIQTTTTTTLTNTVSQPTKLTGTTSGFGVVIPKSATPSMGNALTKTQLPSTTAQPKTPAPIKMEEKPKELSTGSGAVGNVGVPIQTGSLPIAKGAMPSQPVSIGSASAPDTKTGFGFFGSGNKAESDKKDHIAMPHEAPARCFTVTYRHARTFGHTSDEECSSHTNMVMLKHADVNASSVCVRVNGRPVAFKTAKDKNNEVYIGAVAGPGATITARYCTAQYNCNEECKVPKDEFMDAIGGGKEISELKSGIGHWEPQDVTDNLGARLQKELAAFDEPDQKFTEVSAFLGWASETEEAVPACKANQVSTVLSAKR
jgi:hypothetical protein